MNWNKRDRAKSMANHPSRQVTLQKWEKQFREMDRDDEAVRASMGLNEWAGGDISKPSDFR